VTAQSNYKLVEDHFEELPKKIDDLIKKLDNLDSSEAISETKARIAELKAEFMEQKSGLKDRVRDAYGEMTKASFDFANAKGEYLAVLPDEVAQKARIYELQAAFESINKLAQNSYIPTRYSTK
jgi:hypothetical protein